MNPLVIQTCLTDQIKETIDSLATLSQSRDNLLKNSVHDWEFAPPYLHRVVHDRKPYNEQNGEHIMSRKESTALIQPPKQEH